MQSILNPKDKHVLDYTKKGVAYLRTERIYCGYMVEKMQLGEMGNQLIYCFVIHGMNIIFFYLSWEVLECF